MEEDTKLFLMMMLAASFWFCTHIRNVQMTYLIQVRQRIEAIKEKKIRRPKGAPPPRTLMYYERVVLKLSEKSFRAHFRITKTTFQNLCQLLGPILARNVDGIGGRPNTSIEKQILPVLWLLATPESYRSVACRFNIAKSSLFYFFERFVLELSSMSGRFIKWPSTAEMGLIKNQFFRMNGFDIWVIGAIDGTYIVIKAPNEDANVFRTRKCNFALNLQAICVPSLHFIDCFVGFPGSVGDRREYIIGDKAYPCLEWCQVPYIRRTVLDQAQELYNRLLSGTRQVIERAFALLFGRFRRLKFVDMDRQDLIVQLVIACCVLHNLSIAEMDYEDFIQEGLTHVEEMRNQEPLVVTPSPSSLSLLGDKRRKEVTDNLYQKHLAR